MTAAFRSLVVTRADREAHPTDSKHVALVVCPEIPRVMDSDGRSLVDGFDVDNADHWIRLAEDAVDVAGMLARIAVDVTPAVLFNAKGHCSSAPHPDRDDIGAEVREARLAYADDGCGVYLSLISLDRDVVEDGVLPYLVVTVPRNREATWTDRLNDAVERLARGVSMSLCPHTDPCPHQ